MPWVRRRGDKWYAGWKDERGVDRERVTPGTKEAAKALARDLEAKAQRVRMGLEAAAVEPHSWDEVCERYSADVVPSFKNIRSAESQLRVYVRPAFAGRYLATISPADIDSWLQGLRKHKGRGGTMKDSTRECLRLRMSSVFAFAVKRLKWLPKSPMDDAARVKTETGRPAYFTVEEVRRILLAAGHPLRDILAVLFMCGLRKGEVAGLRWEDVDFARRVLNVRHSFDGPTKTGKERAVPIPEALLPYLLSAREDNASEWVFPGPDGKMRKRNWTLAFVFKRCLKRAGINKPLTPHHARHTWATWALDSTKDVRFVQAALGHESIKTTQRYAHGVPEHWEELANKLPYAKATGAQPAALPKAPRPQSLVGLGAKLSERMQEEKPMQDEAYFTWGRRSDEPVRKRPYSPPSVVTRPWIYGRVPEPVRSRRDATALPGKGQARNRGDA